MLMPRKLTIGKTSKISIFQRKTGRWIVDWHDEHGARRNPSFATLKEAEAFQKQKRAELERHREGRFNLDDREMFSQARDLASVHGYTVLQAIQEWHSSKGSSKAMPLGEVIEKFLAAKARLAKGCCEIISPAGGCRQRRANEVVHQKIYIFCRCTKLPNRVSRLGSDR